MEGMLQCQIHRRVRVHMMPVVNARLVQRTTAIMARVDIEFLGVDTTAKDLAMSAYKRMRIATSLDLMELMFCYCCNSASSGGLCHSLASQSKPGDWELWQKLLVGRNTFCETPCQNWVQRLGKVDL
eukprot:6053659-Amphidinium_carterae.1